ncbi:CPBP family intramembrane glutamic endopeptidase [Streptococcus hyointestinalis]|uniref:CPBP family intramembrane glutamic endopeptidase n=1 Tax=Streptococcus hyointestinalis TaxID=1337 RepID=UPI0013DEF261|nr:CPBP family intramembrane glutamic endopeptidase [Streptococcus hyointestinalis]MDD6384108.1 CPBP family intramembrane metalloprotease [Streptococcus hyointestinalis]
MANTQTADTHRYLKWYDILVVTLILFGWFIFKSNAILLGFIKTGDSGSVGAAVDYLPNFIFQSCMLVLTFVYLKFRHFDFKSLPIRLSWSVLLWVPLVFAAMGLISDVFYSVTGYYNYFDPKILGAIDWSFGAVVTKILALSPMLILYSLLNGFYEEFFFLGLLTSVKDEHKWLVLVYSTIIRISFHTYQGMTSALIIGVVVGLFYYFVYKYLVKNLLPFFLVHALADMFGSSLIYLLVNWG